VPEIAKKAELKRTTTYGILDELIQKGLVSYSQKGKARYYSPENPEVLEKLLEKNKKAFENILPELKNLFETITLRPSIRFYEGREGIKRVFADTLNCKSKKLLQIVKVKDFIDVVGEDFSKEYIRKRAEKGIFAFALHPKSGDIYNDTYGKESKKWKRYVRYLPPNTFYASMIMIYDNKVAMISTKKENFGFIIESREFSNTLEAYFQFMWGLGSREPEE
jgi:sugar-specific transcriptional regulator TrmB